MLWIFLVGTAAIIAMGYLMRRRMKAEGKTLNEMLALPMFKGKSVEVSILGGLASLKVENRETNRELETSVIKAQNLLEDPETAQVRELTTLVRMLDKNLITIDEYNKAKQKLFNS